ncbi:hypothetical protein H6G80_04515 [Nostoc sp. FACHB-87]|nr:MULTISPECIES: hypothetical protein [Nostocaceae]MBD2453335.1 hypothetical protein [Nostoc sp. FACHB-87]MBD2475459.1 hypothetical protein [Anabaena sp. FACHB-83]
MSTTNPTASTHLPIIAFCYQSHDVDSKHYNVGAENYNIHSKRYNLGA